ncbi:hypothetical protein HDU96_001494, partial [Phlyctochytrium bullatum]
AFTVDIEGSAPVSRLRSAVANCTRHVASDINLFAVKPGAGVLINDARISTFLASTRWDGGVGVLRVDPTVVETHLPVVWLKDPTDTVAAVCVGDGRDSLLDPALKNKQLRLLVALDGRLDANAATVGIPAMGATLGGALPPPAYVPSDAGMSSAAGSSAGLLSTATKDTYNAPNYSGKALEAQYGSQGTGSNSGASGSLFGSMDAADEKRMLAASYAAPAVVRPASPYLNPSSTSGSYVSGAPPSASYASNPLPYQSNNALPPAQYPNNPYAAPSPVPTGVQFQHTAMYGNQPAAPNGHYESQPPGFGGAGAANAGIAASAVAAKAEEERLSKKKKTTILIIVAVVAALILVAVGAAVGVLLSKKNNDSSNNNSGSQPVGPAPATPVASTTSPAIASVASTSGAPTSTADASTSAASTSSPTTTARRGEVLFNLNLPGESSPALIVNPFNRNNFFVSSTAGSVTESALNGSSRRDFTVANNVVHGMAIVGNTLICADNAAISFVNIDGDTRQQSQGAITNFFLAGRTTSTNQVRFMSAGPTANDGVAIVLNELGASGLSGLASGFVAFVDTASGNGLSYITFVTATEGFPWSLVWLASDRILVGMNFGLVYEYARSGSPGQWTWTRVNQFKVHMGDYRNYYADVRTMLVVPGSRYLLTGGWDQRVRVWDLDALPSTPIANVSTPVETPVAEYAVPDWVYDVAVSPDETEVIIGGRGQTAVVYPMPQRNKNVQTSIQIWRREMGWEIYHFAYYNQSGVTGWLVTGNTRTPAVIAS